MLENKILKDDGISIPNGLENFYPNVDPEL